MESRMTTVDAGQELRNRIKSYLLDDGLQCSQCVLAMLREALGSRASELEAAALPFGRGLVGTGGVCGALTGALIALGAMHETDASDSIPRPAAPLGYLSDQPPTNDWLEVHPTVGTEPPVFSLGRELVARVAEFHPGAGGPVNCAEISGVDWSAPTREQLARYYAPDGGVSRCVRVIGIMVEAVEGLLRESRGVVT